MGIEKIEFRKGFKKNTMLMQYFAFAGGRVYQGFLLNSLPSLFGALYFEEREMDGIGEWFNHNGLTYIDAKYLA